MYTLTNEMLYVSFTLKTMRRLAEKPLVRILKTEQKCKTNGAMFP